MDPLREYENIKNHLARTATKKMLEKNYLLTYQKSRARARSAAVHSTRSVSFDKHVEYSFKKKEKERCRKSRARELESGKIWCGGRSKRRKNPLTRGNEGARESAAKALRSPRSSVPPREKIHARASLHGQNEPRRDRHRHQLLEEELARVR